MSPWVGVTAIVSFGILMYVITRIKVSHNPDVTSYHVADRKVKSVQGSLSLAATWTSTPALFVAATQAYINGWVGAAWFIVPNIATIMLMIPFAKKLREKYPDGFTLSGFMRRRYGKTVQRLYQFEMTSLSTLQVAVNLLAGGMMFSIITGLPMIISSSLVLAFALLYTLRYGVKASFLTDAVQQLLILGGLLIIAPVAAFKTGSELVADGLTGINDVAGVFHGGGASVAVTFGIVGAIGLAAGPVGDQAFWQRTFSIREDRLTRSYILAAISFGLVPIGMSVFGFLASMTNAPIEDAGYVNVEMVNILFPEWVMIPMLIMLLAGMISTIDSEMLSVSSVSTDITADLRKHKAVMLIACLIGLIIANVPGMAVISLWLLFGTVRSATFLITVCTVMGMRLHPQAVATGLIVAMGVGIPLAVYGTMISTESYAKLLAVSITVVMSIGIAWIGTLILGEPEQDVEPNYLTPTQEAELELIGASK